MAKMGGKRVLFNFLISYIVVFLLPVLFLVFFFYPRSTDIIYDNAEEKADSILRQTANHVNMQLMNVWYYPEAIRNNRHLQLQVFEEINYFNTYKIAQEMQNMFGYNSFIEKAVLFNTRTKMFYSFPGSFVLQDFNNYQKTFYYLDWDQEEMMKEIEGLEEVTVRPASSIVDRNRGTHPFKGVTIMMPVPSQGAFSYGVLILVVAERNFSPYSNRTNELNHNLVVIDQQNRIIAQPNNQLELDGDVLMENFTEDSPSSSQITIDDQTYMINLEQSNTYGLKFVNLTPIDEILSEITQLKVKTLLLVGLIFLIEVGLIILLIRVNYHPIKKLRQSALHSVEEELFSDLTEYEVVSYAFDNLQKRNKELVSKEMLNKNISQEYFFIQHLNKTVESNESIIQHAAEQGIQLGDKVCCITFFSMNRNIIELLSLLEEIMAQSHDDQLIFSYRVKGVRHEDFILVLSFTQEDQIKPFIYRIHEMKKDVNIGIGTVEEMRLLSYSYTHSLAALEVATLHHDIHIMSYYDIDVKNANEISKLFEIINLIELSITRKDDAQLRLQLNNLISLMKNDISRIFILNIIFTNTYNVLVKALNKFGSKEEYCYVVPEKDLNIKELEDRLLEKGEQVIEYIMKEGSKTTKVEIALILQFIDTHYMDETISLQLLADEFNMSYSNLSRFFKKQVGKSFVSYIENIRMTEAKRLLRESEQAIQVIARQVGYSNANSFTRLFKKTEGITPGMYRNLYNEKKGGGLG